MMFHGFADRAGRYVSSAHRKTEKSRRRDCRKTLIGGVGLAAVGRSTTAIVPRTYVESQASRRSSPVHDDVLYICVILGKYALNCFLESGHIGRSALRY